MRHQDIHNAIRAAIVAGPFYPVAFDQRTGNATVDTSTPLPLTGVGVSIVPSKSSFSVANRHGRVLTSERSEWIWTARIEFNRAVSFEAWEESLMAPIEVPESSAGDRKLLVRLVASEYNPVPEASPNRGSVAEFTFAVDPLFLRK